MGEVYEAEDLLLNESIALKTVLSDFARDESLSRRFQQEIQLARKVTHPNVCRVFEVGVHLSEDSYKPPLHFFTMQLLRGETLSARIRRTGRMSKEEAYPIAAQMAEGLHAAHQAGVIHRDFKSGNVILVDGPAGPHAVITDFGLARIDTPSSSHSDIPTLTATTEPIGTVVYMSPEQLTGGAVTPFSDIYSLGVVLFEMATGRRPFEDHRILQAALQRLSGPGVTVRSQVPDIDPRWETVILRCLQKEPERRFASAAEVAEVFRTARWRLPHFYWTCRDWIRVSVIFLGMLLVGAGLWYWLTRPYQPNPAALDWYAKGIGALHSMTYEAARKALEQAIAADSRFALAHASLARVLDEMDYSDSAKDSLLRAVTLAQETRLSDEDSRRLRALQFLVSKDYERAAPLFRQLEEDADKKGKPAAALESGWLAQQRDDTAAAAAGYRRAVVLNPRYAAAQLRLGFLFGRRGQKGDLELALKAFAEAQSLYEASSDYEGVTETLWHRANLLNRRSRAAEAMPVIEKGLAVARATDNIYQQIRLQLLQGVAARNLGDAARAAALAQEATDRAAAQGMDNLATSGLVDFGNSFLARGDLAAAETAFRRALELGHRGKVRRHEARAQLSLGSLCEQDSRPEEALRFIESALPFYRQSGYSREYVQAISLMGGVREALGEYGEGIRILREALSRAVQFQDPRLEAQIRSRLAKNLLGQGAWPDALQEYEKSMQLHGASAQGNFIRLQCVALYRRLGRPQDAERSLMEVREKMKKSPDITSLTQIKILQAELSYATGKFDEVLAAARPELSKTGQGKNEATPIRLLYALAMIRKGQVKGGVEMALDVIKAFGQLKRSGEAASARLATAETLLLAGQREPASRLAAESLAFFEPARIWESVWRAHLVAGRAAGEPAQAEVHCSSARSALAQMRSSWPTGNVESYLGRPDIKFLMGSCQFE